MSHSIDISQLADAGDLTQRVGVVFNDEGEPTVGFVIVGKDSQQYREAAERLRVAGVKRNAIKGTRIDTKTEEGALAFDRLVQKNEVELAVAVVVGWFGFTSGGQPAPFSVEAVRTAFKARPTWRERVSGAVENEAGFLPPSPTNSASSPGTSSASTSAAPTA
jgi:hypothetical protein